MTSSANAQTNAAAPDGECTCPAFPGSPPTIAPKNFQALIDGRQYDISTYRFFRSAEFGQPQKELPSHVEPFFDSGMYRIIPEVEIEVGRGVGYAASIFRSPEPGAEGAAWGFDTEIDRADDVPPTVGPGLKVRNDFFTNECGSKAIFFEDGGTSDDFSGNVYRLPVLVRIRSTERDLAFTTFSTTYGITSLFVQNVIAYYPFTGWCIGDRGLESTDFELGEAVEFELTVYDYAGNAGEPKVQALEWPIERVPFVGAGGSGGDPDQGGNGGHAGRGIGVGGSGGLGGSGGSPSGAGGDTTADPSATGGSGCSVRASPGQETRLLFYILLASFMVLTFNRRPRSGL